MQGVGNSLIVVHTLCTALSTRSGLMPFQTGCPHGRARPAALFTAWQHERFFSNVPMPLFYSSLAAIEQQTAQLDHLTCQHCHRPDQLVSHGFVYKKQIGGEPKPVGKRVFCSNRRQRSGCGRTMQLYLDSIIRGLHYAGTVVVAFMMALLSGASVRLAYGQATGAADPRHAWVWLTRLEAQLSCHRSVSHQAPLHDAPAPTLARRPPRYSLLFGTWEALLHRFACPLCSHYQHHTQRSLF